MTIGIGYGDILGLPHKLANNTVLFAFLGGTKEGTLPTVVADASVLANNTFTLNTDLPLVTALAVDFYYVVP